MLTDTLGAPALEAAGERALGTAVGIAIAGLAFLVYGEWAEPGARANLKGSDPLGSV